MLVAIFGFLVLGAINAGRFPLPRGYVYIAVLVLGFAVLWFIPEYIKTQTFYDYFLNTIIVTAGTICISISIGCLAGYGLARYSGIAGVIILVTALGFRSLPGMAYILPYWWFGQRSGLYDTHILLIITLVAINQPFTIWMLRSFFMNIPKEIEESAMVDGGQSTHRLHQRHHSHHVARHHFDGALHPAVSPTAIFSWCASSRNPIGR